MKTKTTTQELPSQKLEKAALTALQLGIITENQFNKYSAAWGVHGVPDQNQCARFLHDVEDMLFEFNKEQVKNEKKPKWEDLANDCVWRDNSGVVFQVLGETMAPRYPAFTRILTQQIAQAAYGFTTGPHFIIFKAKPKTRHFNKTNLKSLVSALFHRQEVATCTIFGRVLGVDNGELVVGKDNPKFFPVRIPLKDVAFMFKAVTVIYMPAE